VALPLCAVCAEPCSAGAPLCGPCTGALRGAAAISVGPPGVEVAVAAGEYEGVIRELAHALKFGRRLALARVAAEAMAEACPPWVLDGTIVPVPAAPMRRAWRGFDAAEEIALALAALTGLPLARCLRRRGVSRQVGRPRERRLTDPPRVRAAGDVPERAVLVDDVHTTGATLAACAAALRSAGCRSVVAVTLARSRAVA
jgi:predicted amidophosphoribosyltransferase